MNPLSQARALVVVAKHPEVGKVKTRLGPALDDAQAFRLYDAFLDDIARTFSTGDYDFAFAYTPPDAPFDGRGLAAYPQRGGTLNQRLHNIFLQNRQRYGGGTLIMSSDSPQVPRSWIAQGFEKLSICDVVLGPASDGGYWIVGMREAHDIFAGVEMSTPRVLARTLERAGELGLRVELLPETFDVDTADDLDLLRRFLWASGNGCLPATRGVLAQIDAAGAVKTI